MPTPHVCPLCQGKNSPATCHPCKGSGVVWDREDSDEDMALWVAEPKPFHGFDKIPNVPFPSVPLFNPDTIAPNTVVTSPKREEPYTVKVTIPSWFMESTVATMDAAVISSLSLGNVLVYGA